MTASYAADLYSTDAILDPHPHYEELRRLGPVVWLDRHKCFAFHATRNARPPCATMSSSCRAKVCP